jgi:TPR repeat protein
MRHLTSSLVVLTLVVGCGNSTSPPPSPSASAPIAAASAPAALDTDAGLPSLKPTTLVRKGSPHDRRVADEKACDGGDAAACRRAADRYRGYGHIAGCGVDRPGAKPRRLVTAADAKGDRREYDRWIRKVCALGDEEACLQGTANLDGASVDRRSVQACSRSGVGDCPHYQWVVGMHPEKKKLIDEARRKYITSGNPAQLFVELFSKEKKRGGDELPKEIADLAQRICTTSRECDEVMLMLDENGYTAAATAPVRKAVGEALTAACLDGECECGEAARYLDPGDARVLDLARIGCDDGEPDACFVLGDLYERGAGLDKDLVKAFALYDQACPSVMASDGRADIYSKAACDRLSAWSEAGTDVEKDRDRAFFYAKLACPGDGVAIDHSFCVHRAIFHSVNEYRSMDHFLMTTQDIGRLIFHGPEGKPIEGKECSRPSVAELCKKTAPLIH